MPLVVINKLTPVEVYQCHCTGVELNGIMVRTLAVDRFAFRLIEGPTKFVLENYQWFSKTAVHRSSVSAKT
jgi:hypothetical protein